MPIACVICNDTLEGNPECELFPFPDKAEQPDHYQEYLLSCGLSESMLPTEDQLYICSKHFASNCFELDPEQRALRGDAVPTLNLNNWIDLGYDDESEDIQMLDEYIPLYNAGLATASTSGICRPMVETLLVPKPEPMDDTEVEGISYTEAEVKTEAPEIDETTPDPFGNLEPGVSSDKVCILCNNSETLNPDCRLYVFPRKIPKIYRKWMLAAGLSIEQYKNRDIYSCQRHFPENGFFANGKFIQSWATPRLNLPESSIPSTSTARPAEHPTAVSVRTASKSATGKEKELGPKIVIKHNPQNRKNAIALNIDPDNYAKVFTKVVMDLVPKKLKFNGQERPVTGTIVFSSNLF